MNLQKMQSRLTERFGTSVFVALKQNCIVVSGHLSSWSEAVEACQMCVVKEKGIHVVNAVQVENLLPFATRLPALSDTSLEGKQVDVLVIGGGISGTSIARELMKWKLDVLLVEKEADVALHASGRNDGEVHPGMDLGTGSLKQAYVVKGNQMFEAVCKELDVPFRRSGQYVGLTDKKLYLFGLAFAWHRRHKCKVKDTRLISKEELLKKEPNMHPDICYAIYNPSAGCVCPYGLTIAYGENAIANGAVISLETAVLDMEMREHRIASVKTNRGTIYPKLVINAAGVFAEDIAKMADDHFYSIHPRKGTDAIFDKKAGHLIQGIVSVKSLQKSKSHTKGGGTMRTVHDNLLIGPDAVETYEKENFATEAASVDHVLQKQKAAVDGLEKKDIITYFAGVRACTFEEDYILEKGRNTKNLVHCAGIQSPGLTTAPAVALDIAKMAVELLAAEQTVKSNPHFQPKRKGLAVLRAMSKEERHAMIQKNPDYGIIVCRCEEISKGEILDALHSALSVPTVDGIKKRLRPGMGRCQGGFCMPLIVQIIAEDQKLATSDVRRTNAASIINFSYTKGSDTL